MKHVYSTVILRGRAGHELIYIYVWLLSAHIWQVREE